MVYETDKPLVSIICDVYNQEQYIRTCLNSLINQKTTFKYVILIHDDASTDSSQQIIKEYINKYPNLFLPIFQRENQYSKGVSIWDTYQLPRVETPFIAFCEGDDYWTDPKKLQNQVDFLINNPDYTMCFHNVTEHFEDGSIPDRLHWDVEKRDYSDLEIFSNWIIQTASVVMRANVIQSTFYNTMFHIVKPVHGDIPLFVVCAMCGKVFGFSNIMSLYRRHNTNISSIEDLEGLKKEAEYMMRFLHCFGKKFTKPCIHAYVRDYTSLFIYSRKQGFFCWKYLWKAFYRSPYYFVKCIYESAKASLRRRLL